MVHSSHVGFPGHIAHRVNRIRRPAGAPLQPASNATCKWMIAHLF